MIERVCGLLAALIVVMTMGGAMGEAVAQTRSRDTQAARARVASRGVAVEAAAAEKVAEPFSDPDGSRPEFPGEFCSIATLPDGSTELPLVIPNTTVDRFDLLNLSFEGPCAGGGPQFSGTGIGPDLVYKIHVDIECSLQVTVRMFDGTPPPDHPAAADWDVALYIILQPLPDPDDDPEDLPLACGVPDRECVRVADGAGIGQPESITFTARPDQNYYAVVDGYFGASGLFELEIADRNGVGCKLSQMALNDTPDE